MDLKIFDVNAVSGTIVMNPNNKLNVILQSEPGIVTFIN
jgi:hypothetical protein